VVVVDKYLVGILKKKELIGVSIGNNVVVFCFDGDSSGGSQ